MCQWNLLAGTGEEGESPEAVRLVDQVRILNLILKTRETTEGFQAKERHDQLYTVKKISCVA